MYTYAQIHFAPIRQTVLATDPDMNNLISIYGTAVVVITSVSIKLSLTANG